MTPKRSLIRLAVLFVCWAVLAAAPLLLCDYDARAAFNSWSHQRQSLILFGLVAAVAAVAVLIQSSRLALGATVNPLWLVGLALMPAWAGHVTTSLEVVEAMEVLAIVDPSGKARFFADSVMQMFGRRFTTLGVSAILLGAIACSTWVRATSEGARRASMIAAGVGVLGVATAIVSWMVLAGEGSRVWARPFDAVEETDASVGLLNAVRMSLEEHPSFVRMLPMLGVLCLVIVQCAVLARRVEPGTPHTLGLGVAMATILLVTAFADRAVVTVLHSVTADVHGSAARYARSLGDPERDSHPGEHAFTD